MPPHITRSLYTSHNSSDSEDIAGMFRTMTDNSHVYFSDVDPYKPPKPKCYLCKKLLVKAYIVKNRWNEKTKVCSNCKNLYDIVYREAVINGNDKAITKMIKSVFNTLTKNRTYVITKGKKTRKQGTFIRPSKLTTHYPYSVYQKMRKKCCHWCEKQFIKTFTLAQSNTGGTIRMCRDCEYLFKLMLKEKERKSDYPIRKINEIMGYKVRQKKRNKARDNHG